MPAEKKQTAVIVPELSPGFYSALQSLCVPDFPAEKEYVKLSKILKDQIKPEFFPIAEKYLYGNVGKTW